MCVWGRKERSREGGRETHKEGEREAYTLRTLLFAGTKFSEISDLPNFR